MTLPIPINRTTINRLFRLTLSEAEIADFLKKQAEPVARIKTAEDLVLAQVGRELYETFFRGYTRKQWGLDPSELDKSVTARIPVRINDDDRYFTDTFQMMPRFGFTRLFENMLDSPNIKIMLNVDYREVMDEIAYDRMIYTGPIDEFFEYRYGKLPYRSLRFQHETLNQEQFQPVATINYPSEKVPFTRVTEYKHLTGQVHPKTAITYEFPTAEGDPYYPVPRADNAELYLRYRQLADAAHDIEFVGRLATYRYYNMDQVVAQALSTYARISAAGPLKIKTAAREPAAALS
jgi:UDP-galactopyranose mutase